MIRACPAEGGGDGRDGGGRGPAADQVGHHVPGSLAAGRRQAGRHPGRLGLRRRTTAPSRSSPAPANARQVIPIGAGPSRPGEARR